MLYFAADFLHRRRVADYPRKSVASRVVIFEQDVLSAKPGFLQSALHEQKQMTAVHWFLEKLVRAFLHCLDRFIDSPIGSQHDHRGI